MTDIATTLSQAGRLISDLLGGIGADFRIDFDFGFGSGAGSVTPPPHEAGRRFDLATP